MLNIALVYNSGGGGVPLGSGAAEAAQARQTRDHTNDVSYRTRAAISWDVRQQTGTRTQWNPVPQLDIGLEVLYTHLNTAYKGAATAGGYGLTVPAGGLPGRRPKRLVRDVPLAAQLLSMIGCSIVATSGPWAGNRRGLALRPESGPRRSELTYCLNDAECLIPSCLNDAECLIPSSNRAADVS